MSERDRPFSAKNAEEAGRRRSRTQKEQDAEEQDAERAG